MVMRETPMISAMSSTAPRRRKAPRSSSMRTTRCFWLRSHSPAGAPSSRSAIRSISPSASWSDGTGISDGVGATRIWIDVAPARMA